MKNKQDFKNSSFSILQTIAMALASLVLFKLMVIHAGLKVTGLWSYLSSITTITSFGSFGFANALLFYIPKYRVQQNDARISTLINTSLISVLILTTLLCIISYLAFNYIIPLTVESDLQQTALQLLPLIVISFFFSAMSTVYLSVLDSLLLMHVRAKINITGSVIFLVSGYLLLMKLGIIGIPIAQLIQNIFLLATSILVAKKQLPNYSFSPRINGGVFREISRYGFNFQLISLTQIVSEPFMKAMITKFSGSHITAMFDFCLKFLSVFRSLIISANQTIVPQLTILKTQGNFSRVRAYYRSNLRIVLFLSLVFFISPLVVMDAISVIFLSSPSSEFNFVLCNIALGLLVNAIALPAHFYYMGMGNLKWNVINNVVTAALIFISAPLLGHFIGGKYVVMCWSISAVLGSSLLIISFNRENDFTLKPFFNKNVLQLMAGLLVGIVVNYCIQSVFAGKVHFAALLCIHMAVWMIVVVYPIFTNIIFRRILHWIRVKMPVR